MSVNTGNNIPGTYGPYFNAGAPTAAVNEIQTISSTATGGTFKISFRGEQTGALAYNASAATIQTALRALASINGANVSCSGGALPTDVVVTFIAALAGENVDTLVIDNTLATGGTVTVANTTPGVAGTAKGALIGAVLIDITNAKIYVNTGTAISPVWTLNQAMTQQAAPAALGATTNITAVPGAFADLAAVQTYLAGANAVPNIETRLDNLETKVNAILTALLASGLTA